MAYYIINHLSVVSKHTQYDSDLGFIYVWAKMSLRCPVQNNSQLIEWSRDRHLRQKYEL